MRNDKGFTMVELLDCYWDYGDSCGYSGAQSDKSCKKKPY